jgi:hypothetical protein
MFSAPRTQRRTDFVARINAAAEREDDGDPIDPATRTGFWVTGSATAVLCIKTSGAARPLSWPTEASSRCTQRKGWWRTRPAQERYDLPARYSLIVSIRTPETDVDLYTPIAQQVAAQAAVPVLVNT